MPELNLNELEILIWQWNIRILHVTYFSSEGALTYIKEFHNIFPYNLLYFHETYIGKYKYPISKVRSSFSVLNLGSCLIHESYKYCWQKLLSKCYQMYWTKKMIAFLMMALMMQIADVPNHLWVWCLSSGIAQWTLLESWVPMDWIITSAI